MYSKIASSLHLFSFLLTYRTGLDLSMGSLSRATCKYIQFLLRPSRKEANKQITKDIILRIPKNLLFQYIYIV